MKGPVVLAVLALASACKEKGTITIDLSGAEACGAERVRFQAVKNGTCSCTCGSCACETSGNQVCIQDVCAGSGCTLEEARSGALEFEPPSEGLYALTYQFFDGAVPASTVSVVCVIVEVQEDGTASSVMDPDPMCCATP